MLALAIVAVVVAFLAGAMLGYARGVYEATLSYESKLQAAKAFTYELGKLQAADPAPVTDPAYLHFTPHSGVR